MGKKDRRKRKRSKQKSRSHVKQRQLLRKKRRSLHDKHKRRRKKDCVLGMPFIIAFHGDPTKTYYCADYPSSFELIPRTNKYPNYSGPFARLKRYMQHHVTQIHDKVLIYKAG
jgi:hypothetical protein